MLLGFLDEGGLKVDRYTTVEDICGTLRELVLHLDPDYWLRG
jgi:hypothetical protein